MTLYREQFTAAASRLFGPIGEDALAQLEQLSKRVHVRRAEYLFRQHDPSDGVYVVISGRMHVVRERPDGTSAVIGEAMPGETIGEMSFFTSDHRTASVCAARDAQLIKFPNDAFERVITAHPEIVRELMRVQFARLQRSTGEVSRAVAVDVAVVALDDQVDLAKFCARLAESTSAMGSTLLLDPEDVDRRLGIEGISRVSEEDPRDSPLVAWLNEQEARYRFVIYQTDRGVTEWTERCLRQADRVLLVASASGTPAAHPIDDLLGNTARVGAPRRMLVLLHPGGDCLPSQTARWLQSRKVDEHHHVRWNEDVDFARLARFLAGRAVGLVLGGGGARGFAHIGVLRALREAGIAVDMVGGTSMGASIAAQYALGWSPRRMLDENRRVWVKLRPQKDYTLPIVSLLSSRIAGRCARLMYGDTQIEDLWLRFFCVSSDLARANTVIHDSGPLLTALTASASVAGITPPVLLEGRLLCDGAFLNNVPADIMRERGCGRVIASEVTVEEDEAFTCERVPTPWEILRNKFRRRKTAVKFPSIIEILLRASMLASSRRQDDAVKTADLVFHPPINEFGLMDFDAIEKLETVGYEHAVAQIEEWRKAGSL